MSPGPELPEFQRRNRARHANTQFLGPGLVNPLDAASTSARAVELTSLTDKKISARQAKSQHTAEFTFNHHASDKADGAFMITDKCRLLPLSTYPAARLVLGTWLRPGTHLAAAQTTTQCLEQDLLVFDSSS